MRAGWMHERGQSSMDSLLVMGFVVVVSMIILIPFVQNQSITNAALSAKLLVLPYLGHNSFPVHVSSVDPQVANGNLSLDLITSGELDSDTRGSLAAAGVCMDLCTQIRQSGAYAQNNFTWTNLGKSSSLVVCNVSCT